MASRILAIFLALLTLTLAAPNPRRGPIMGVPISNPEVAASDIIANRYIVVYNSSAGDEAISAHQAKWIGRIGETNVDKRGLDGRALSTKVHPVKIGSWNAMALEADARTVSQISDADEVAYVEADARVRISAMNMQGQATSGLARISHADVGEAGYVFDSTAGEGTTAFVVDAGIMVTHSEFQGRATFAANFVNDVDTDENGHGSHVAGTIGGRTFGVAKRARLVAVKVLDASGSGTNSGVLAGMNFVVSNVTARNLAGKAVMNMSLGGGRSSAINEAIDALTAAGVVCVVAAGNGDEDTTNTSPGSAAAAITVGAIDQRTDARASFSNFGGGVDVLSVGIANDTETATLTGTSMASPHVAGLVAYLMALEGLTGVDDVVRRMHQLARATGARVKNNAQGTMSLIANNGNY